MPATASFGPFPANRKDSALFYENLEGVYRESGPPDLIVVGLGPGSYAGVRIAIATAAGLKAATNARLVGLPSICAIDQSEYLFVGDARRSSFFFAHVVRGRCVEGPKLASEAEIRAKLQAFQRLPAIATQSLPQFEDVTIEHPSALRLVELATEAELPDRRRARADLFAGAVYYDGEEMNSSSSERCWAEVDCAALRHNARVARERIGPGTELLAVVKANGYGHGMVEVAQALREDG
jgi:tRNA A37 threonylcarbamoyladenosine modification protein TsaB